MFSSGRTSEPYGRIQLIPWSVWNVKAVFPAVPRFVKISITPAAASVP